MSGMMRKGLTWLGLGPDDRYDYQDDYDEYEDFDDADEYDDEGLVATVDLRDEVVDIGDVERQRRHRQVSPVAPVHRVEEPVRVGPIGDDVVSVDRDRRVVRPVPSAGGSVGGPGAGRRPGGPSGADDIDAPTVRMVDPRRARAGTAAAPEPIRSNAVRQIATPEPPTRPHVIEPETFNDAQEVGDRFRKKQPVILNLRGLERGLARRLLDFSSGVTYGLGGTVGRIASHVYLLTPADVELSGEDRRRLRDQGLLDD